MSDHYHCHCFKILESHFDLFKNKLEANGFEDKLQFQNGHLYGRIKKINAEEQIHIKVMPSGVIEAEIEPSHDYPFAHLNQKHSYSAHNQLQQLLHQFGIPYIRNWSIPLSCIRPIVVKPFKPTHAKVIVGAIVTITLIGALTYALAKSKS
ncbi:MAG: hypothetical protein LDL06_03170 [Candidatus Nitrosotenuis sp.]|nr:hypothetical protein [Candidatus Nitrosotenuis sp.]